MRYTKDPNAVLDYHVDWSDWLGDDTVDSSSAAVETGPVDTLTIDSDTLTDGVHTIWLSGGTVGATYRVRSRVTTTAGRTEDRSFTVAVWPK